MKHWLLVALVAMGCAPRVARVALDVPAVVSVRDAVPFSVKPLDAQGRALDLPVSFEVSDPDVLQVEDGSLRCLRDGRAKVTSVASGVSASAEVACELKTCLVLSVGGPNGLAHLGVIEALKERGVRVDCVFGNSMGAVIGALWASEPDADPVGRWRGLVARYLETTGKELGVAGVIGGVLGALVALVKSDGEFGLDTILAAVGGGGLGLALFDRFDNARFARVFDAFVGRRIEELPLSFATSVQRRSRYGLEPPSVISEGPVGPAVAGSANNPFVFGDFDMEKASAIDPGADRVAAVPVEEACRHFRPWRIIAVNVTGHAPFHSALMDCRVDEIRIAPVDLPKDALVEAMRAQGEVFERLRRAGREAAFSALD